MKISNHHIRKSSLYVARTVNNQSYHFYAYDWTSEKSKAYSVAKRIEAGKLSIPENCNVYSGITIVYIKADGSLSATQGV